MRYFEIYVPGKNGYSLYVKSDEVPFPQPDLSYGCVELDYQPDEDALVQMAVKAKALDPQDAQIVKYVTEISEEEIENEAGVPKERITQI